MHDLTDDDRARLTKLANWCGHTARWHGQEIGAPEGSGGCEFNGDCECKRFLLRRPPEDTGPGSYGTDEPSEGSGAPLPEAECPACHKPITPTITDECPECGCFQYSEDPASRASAYPDAQPLPEGEKCSECGRSGVNRANCSDCLETSDALRNAAAEVEHGDDIDLVGWVEIRGALEENGWQITRKPLPEGSKR